MEGVAEDGRVFGGGFGGRRDGDDGCCDGEVR